MLALLANLISFSNFKKPNLRENGTFCNTVKLKHGNLEFQMPYWDYAKKSLDFQIKD
jgi:hypothetical protein